MTQLVLIAAILALLGGCAAPNEAVAQNILAANPIVVTQDGAPGRLIGMHATGPQADLDRLLAVTKAAGFPSQQMDGPEGWQLVIVFPPGKDQASILTFVERLRSSEFATLQFRSAVVPIP